jgi:competence ComEA-like helix-hairpin-helix protein
MWGLTRQEQRITLFLLTTFAVGCLVLWWRQQRPAPPVEPRVLHEFAERSLPAPEEDAQASAAEPSPPVKKPASGPVDLNSATLDDLMGLPGIGAVMAQRIVDHRRAHGGFAKPEDLMRVKGIGKKTYQKLQPLIAVK